MKLFEKRNNKTAVKNILTGLENMDLPHETLQAIHGWLESDDSKEEKECQLKRIFKKQFSENAVPKEFVYQKLLEAHEKLGFPASAVPRRRVRIPLSSRVVQRVAVAAVFMLLAGTGFVLMNSADDRAGLTPQEYIAVTAAPGSEEEITLPDGSTVKLEEGTVFKYSGDFLNDRTVYLDGNAWFKVERLEGKTFTVNTNSITVTVLGTEFQVAAAEDQNVAHVMLHQGKVMVAADGIEDTYLEPGQHCTYDREYRLIDVDTATEEEREMISRALGHLPQPNLDFDHPLSDIFDSLSRYLHKSIIIQDRIDLDRCLNVSFEEDESAEEIMSLLRELTSEMFDYEITDDAIIITSPK